jgi:hypothetical protein
MLVLTILALFVFEFEKYFLDFYLLQIIFYDFKMF